MELTEIVMKLIGSCTPMGESNGDIRRLENAKKLTDLTHDLLMLIFDIAADKDSHEGSVRVIGQECQAFLDSVKESIELHYD